MRSRKSKNPNLYDELNFARFGVVSMHSRVDQSITAWKAEFVINDRHFRVESITPQGRPHGIDTDMLIALETIFVANSCPADNWIHTTAYEVRELMALANNGENYRRIRDSIRRLYFTSVIVGRRTSIVGSKTSWDNVGVRFLEGLRYRDQHDEGELSALDSDATLSIRLGEQLADSLRMGVTQVLDGQLLLQLEQPPARALYRTLQAHRRIDGQDAFLLKEMTVSLEEWRKAVGLTTSRIDLTRRALKAAHDELLAVGYLQEVHFAGRGQNATVHYRFAELDAPDPALVVMLRQVGVSVARASALAAKYPERVEAALKFLSAQQQSRAVRNPGGLVADLLEHPEKYELAPEFEASEKVRANRTQTQRQHLLLETEQAEVAAQAELEALSDKSLEEQWEAKKATIKLLLGRAGQGEVWERLEELALNGTLPAVELSRQLIQAKADGQLEETLARLSNLAQ